MKPEKLNAITKKLRESGFGWISEDDCRKIIILVQSELVLNAAFTPLDNTSEIGNELFQRTMKADYGDPERAALMKEVWTPTPWMIDVLTDGAREQEMWQWCYRTFGTESSPIHKKEGVWHRGNVTIQGRTWFGFKTEAMMILFKSAFPISN